MIYLLFLLLTLQIQSNIVAQWQEVQLPFNAMYINNFININDTMFVYIGDNKVYRNIDGVWERIEVGHNGECFNELFSVENKLFVRSKIGNNLYRSDDCGNNWTRYSIPQTNGYDQLSYSGNNMYLLNYKSNKFWVSKDYGSSWTSKRIPRDSESYSKFFAIDSLIIWQSNDNYSSYLFLSKDLGDRWRKFDIEEEASDLQLFTKNNNSLIIVSKNKLFRSEDEGYSWERIDIDSNLISSSDLNYSNNIRYFIHNNSILLLGMIKNDQRINVKSTDMGSTWFNNTSGYTGYLNPWDGLTFSNGNLYGISTGEGAKRLLVYQSVNDSVWKIIETDTIYPRNVFVNNESIFINGGSSIYRSDNRGVTWQNVTNNFKSNYTRVSHSNDSFTFVALDSSNYISYDKGISWQLIENLYGLKVESLKEIKGAFLFATNDGNLYYSNDLTSNKRLIASSAKNYYHNLHATESIFITYTYNDSIGYSLNFYDRNGKELDYDKKRGVNLTSDIIELDNNIFMLASDNRYLMCISDSTVANVKVNLNSTAIIQIDTLLLSSSISDDKKQLLVYKSINSGNTWDSVDAITFDSFEPTSISRILHHQVGNSFFFEAHEYGYSSKGKVYKYDLTKDKIYLIDTLPGRSTYHPSSQSDNFIFTNNFFLYKKPIQQWLLPILTTGSPDHLVICNDQILELKVSKVGDNDVTTDFNIELSDSYGNFLDPLIIGNGKVQDSTVAICKLPKNVPEGTNYRIRASSESYISVHNSTNLIIPRIEYSKIKGSAKVNPNSEFIYSVNHLNGYKYEWYIESGNATIVNQSKNVVLIRFEEEGFVKIKVVCESQEGCKVDDIFTTEVISDTLSTDFSSNPFYITGNIAVGSDNLVISFYRKLENVQVDLIDILGNIRGSDTNNHTTEEVKLPVSHLTAGVYFIRVKSRDKYYTEKFMVN